MGDLLTLREAAESLGRSYHFVYRLVRRGDLPAKTVNGRAYIARPSLDHWLTTPTQRSRKPARTYRRWT